ncbi:alpha/beta hydrolase [Steroidobacter denitrificans]|uniref:alpha/beta hydrolase n=1 Tax=Steroidobacter denitrificans TaxID=465721 RepID=UPI0009F943F4|nr:alpha/beta fold hydrolase [Steroidobacter denitrificans]
MTHANIYTRKDTPEFVELSPASPATAAVIWLHGLGADGFDFVPLVDELRLPPNSNIRFVFPHAAPRPITLNNGYVMRAWYDVKGLGSERIEDEAGIRETEALIRRYIDHEMAQGVTPGRIVLAGFSQGGAIALHTALRYPQRLAGILALSTYLPLHKQLEQERSPENRDLPILMCHGTQDPMIGLDYAKASCEMLQTLGYPVDWRSYPMAHQVCMEEVQDISNWLQQRLPPVD